MFRWTKTCAAVLAAAAAAGCPTPSGSSSSSGSGGGGSSSAAGSSGTSTAGSSSATAQSGTSTAGSSSRSSSVATSGATGGSGQSSSNTAGSSTGSSSLGGGTSSSSAVVSSSAASSSGGVVSGSSNGTSSGTQAFNPANLLLWDPAPNSVNPDDSEATVLATMQANDQGSGGGWTGVKLMNGQVAWNADPPHDGSLYTQCQPTGFANGFVYTVDPGDIAEHAGVVPGFNHRAYMFEGWAAACGGQEDMYVQWGDGVTDGQIPSDVWFQFWYFQEADPEWRHLYSHPKFIYACRGSYPCQTGDYDWLLTRHITPQMPWLVSASSPDNVNLHGERYVNFKHGGTLDGNPVMFWPNSYTVGDPSSGGSIGQSLRSTPTFDTGRWQLVRVHMDTSPAAQAANQELLEAWVRDYGNPNWTLTTRWRAGLPVAPDDPTAGAVNFAYNLNGATYGYGHRIFRTPANMTGTSGPYGVGLDAGGNTRYALADIAMAAGTNAGGVGAAALPDHAHYGY